MAPRAKTLFQAMSVLIGLIGVCCLLAALAMAVGFVGFSRLGADKVVDGLSLSVMLILALATAFCFLYVAYLAWVKPSPTAVKYICGTLAYLIWITVLHFFFIPQAKSAPSPDNALLSFLVLVGIYYAYRAVTYYFTKKIFFAPNASA